MMQVMPSGFMQEEQPFEGLLNIYTQGIRARIRSTHADASATPLSDQSLLIQIPMSGAHSGKLDNAAHAIANVIYQFPVEGLKETLEYIGSRWGMDSAVPVYEAMQSARTLIYGQSHFPYRNVAYDAMAHGAEWRQSLGRTSTPITAAGAVWATALGLDPSAMTTHPHYIEVVNRYRDQIKAAVLSPKIEDFYDTLTTLMAEFSIPGTAEPATPPPPPPTPPGGDEPGHGNNPDPEGEAVPSEGEGESGAAPSVPPPPSPEREARVQEEKDNILKRANGAERTVIKRHERRFNNHARGRKIGRKAHGKLGNHEIELHTVPSEPTVMLHQASVLARDNNAGINIGSLKTTGDPTHKIWQMSYGNMKVWRGQPPRPGKVAVLIDMSGSMGCWCGVCSNSTSARRVKDSYEYRPTSGVIAMQAAAVISESNSDVTVAGYAGQNQIIRIEPGMQPICRSMVHIPSATPTCVGLEWMRYQVRGSADGATIVLITDGSPSACSGGRIPADHTKQMAQQLHDSGVRFACIIVNDPGSEALSLYPSPITAVVNTMDDLRNVQVILDSLK